MYFYLSIDPIGIADSSHRVCKRMLNPSRSRVVAMDLVLLRYVCSGMIRLHITARVAKAERAGVAQAPARGAIMFLNDGREGEGQVI